MGGGGLGGLMGGGGFGSGFGGGGYATNAGYVDPSGASLGGGGGGIMSMLGGGGGGELMSMVPQLMKLGNLGGGHRRHRKRR